MKKYKIKKVMVTIIWMRRSKLITKETSFYLHLYQVARKFKDTKFPLVISLLFVLIAFPTMDSKPAKWGPLNEEVRILTTVDCP